MNKNYHNPANAADIARVITRAAKRTERVANSQNKVFISDVYENMTEMFRSEETIEEFKSLLWDLNNSGHIELRRADIPKDINKNRASEIARGPVTFHYLIVG